MPPKPKDDNRSTLDEIFLIVKSLQADNQSLREEIKSLKSIVLKNQNNSYASAVVQRSTQTNKNEPVIIIKPKSSQQSKTTKNDVINSVNPADLSVGVSVMRECKQGAVVIGCDDEKSLNKLKTSIIDEIGDKYKVEESKLKNPRLKILNVEITDTDDDANLIKNIIAQNNIAEDYESDFKIIHKQTVSNGHEQNVILELNPTMHKYLLKNEKINIGWKKCRITDHVSILRCFNCSKFGHYSKDCNSERTCPLCMQDHRLSECKSSEKEYKCVNCKSAADKYKTNVKFNHSALDNQCPSYLRVLKSRKRRINYCDS